jgi:two-component system sensor histidine kinase HydH
MIDRKNKDVELLHDIAVIANQASGIDEVLKTTLKKICRYTGSVLGQVYMVDPENNLIFEPLWYSTNPKKYRRFHKETEKILPERGKGLRGIVFATGKPLWIEDVTRDKNFRRIGIVKDSDLKSAFAVPILIRSETVGVLEFFSSRTIKAGKQIHDVMYNIGVQLGRVVERQMAIEAIKDSEAKFRAVAESANEAVIIADQQGDMIYLNKSTIRMFGYKKNELLGKPIRVLMSERFLESFRQAFSRFMIDHVSYMLGKNIEMAGKRKDGSEFPLELSLSTWNTHSGIHFTGIIRDITNMKLGQEKIMKSEKRLKDAQHLAHLGSFEWDIKNNRMTWSEEMYNICGLKQNEFAGTFEAFLVRVHPEDRGFVKRTIETTSKEGKTFGMEIRIVRPGKEVRVLFTKGEYESDEQDNIVKLLGASQDITEQKNSEAELRKTYEKLKETQNELIHSEKLAALGRFSSGIAHEIRNPLANISALAQIVLRRAKIDGKMKQHLKYILANTEIASKIIQDLLNFASPEDIVFQPGDLGKVINKLCNIVRQRCENHRVKLVKEISPSMPRIMLNEKKLNTAFMNFISNSLDAMPKGGTLSINACRDNKTNDVKVTFEDTGSGISQEYMDKIFEPFFTTKDTGTGLGLSLAYQVIRSHSGRMDIQSKTNEGTKIIVKFPILN